ncbi:MAG: hypothetical protein ACREUX_01205 [Burkholderiales bacterium]
MLPVDAFGGRGDAARTRAANGHRRHTPHRAYRARDSPSRHEQPSAAHDARRPLFVRARVAAACVYGDAGIEAFSTESLSHPEVARLRSRIELRQFEPALPRPNDRPARITLHFSGGETLVSECLSARGGPDQPFDETVILEKANAIAAPVYPHFLPTVRALAALEPGRMQLRWREVVAELTAA